MIVTSALTRTALLPRKHDRAWHYSHLFYTHEHAKPDWPLLRTGGPTPALHMAKPTTRHISASQSAQDKAYTMTAILYSFRRCPYAIRARLALMSSGVRVELRDILLRDKPAPFLLASPSGTVPCLVTDAGVIDESLEIMVWALQQSDPDGWLNMPASGRDWIARNDGPFKQALDRVKYASRYPEEDAQAHLATATAHLAALDTALDDWLFDRPSLADYAMLPFIRQFAFIDKAWFDAQPWPRLHAWLERFLASDSFAAVMAKPPVWTKGDAPRLFP